MKKLTLFRLLGASGLIVGSRVDFATVPTAQGATTVSRARAFSHFSQAVSIRYWFAHPDQAPGNCVPAFSRSGRRPPSRAQP